MTKPSPDVHHLPKTCLEQCRAVLILFCLVLVVLARPAVAAVDQEDAQDTLQEDSIPVFNNVMTAHGELQAAQDVILGMRDGTQLSLDIYRPDDNARHPSLYAAGPYPHNLSLLEDTSNEVGPIAWYVSQGFAVIVANVRGTGLSGGDFSFFARQEQQDHYEIIQWIGSQPWSDGQVAGTGAGYYAASQWLMAVQNPPSLECIAPVNGTLDPFREWVAPGGLTSNTFINDWYEAAVRLPNAYAPDAPRLVNMDLRLTHLMHPYLDDWWQERSSLDSTRLINVPVFAIQDWGLEPTDPGLTSTINALDALNVVNKLLIINPAGELPLYQDSEFLARELLPYYQWCFSGRNPASAFIERPRIRYQVRGQDTIKRESDWPPGNIAQQAWLLEMPAGSVNGGRLVLNQSVAGSGFTNVERGASDESLRFVSEPLENDLEITGPVMLELYAASTTSDMAFTVSVSEAVDEDTPVADFRLPGFLSRDVPEPDTGLQDSTRILVTRGSLKASSRLRDNIRSTEYLPVYAFLGSESLSPGQVYRQDIALRQTAYRFRAGNRIVLEISPVNDGSLPITGRDTLYHSTRYPTRLWLPVVQSPQLPAARPATTPLPQDSAPEANPGIFVPR